MDCDAECGPGLALLPPGSEKQANAEAEDYQSVVKEDEEQEEGEDQDMWSVGVPEDHVPECSKRRRRARRRRGPGYVECGGTRGPCTRRRGGCTRIGTSSNRNRNAGS